MDGHCTRDSAGGTLTSRHSPTQEPTPRSDEEWLLHPIILRALRHAQTKGSIAPLREETVLRAKWRPSVLEGLHTFVQTGDLTRLVEVVQADWRTVVHPLVFCQLFHLSQLRYRPSWDALDHGGAVVADSEEEILPRGTKRAAQDTLQRLIVALCKSLLPGWGIVFHPKGWKVLRKKGQTLIRQIKPRGRPRGVDFESAESILWQISDIKDALAAVGQEKPVLFLRTGKADRLAAAIEIVKEVYARLPWAQELVRPPAGPEYGPHGFPNLVPRPIPLPQVAAQKITRLAEGTRQPIEPAKLIQTH